MGSRSGSWGGIFPCSVNGPAAEDIDKSCRDFEADQSTNKDVDDAEHVFVREMALVEQEDGYSDKWDDISVERIKDIERL